MNETEKAYIASCFDCEGSIGLRYYKNKENYSTFHARAAVVNTDRRLIDFLLKTTGMGWMGFEQLKGNRKNAYRWVLRREEMEILFPIIMPYFILKRRQAELVLKYFSMTTVGRPGPNREQKKYLEEKLKIVEELQKLNKRGVICG